VEPQAISTMKRFIVASLLSDVFAHLAQSQHPACLTRNYDSKRDRVYETSVEIEAGLRKAKGSKPKRPVESSLIKVDVVFHVISAGQRGI
jgi:hypothetical protein